MATDNATNDPKTATADEAAIQDLPESQDSSALTPDEEKKVIGGAASSALVMPVTGDASAMNQTQAAHKGTQTMTKFAGS